MVNDSRPPAPGPDLRKWADNLYEWLTASKSQGRATGETVLLAHRKAARDERATVAGLVMYDQTYGCPIVSRAGQWVPLSSSFDVFNIQLGADYTVIPSDVGKVIVMQAGGAHTVTIGLDADLPLPRGSVFRVLQIEVGNTSIDAVAGVTINGTDGGSKNAGGVYSALTAVKLDDNAWVVIEGGL